VSKLLSSKAGVVAVAAGTAAVIAAAGWFLLVKPKQNEAKKLDASIATVEQSIAARRAELARPKAAIRVRPSDLYRLSKALPGKPDIAGVMLEINRLAGLHGITFRSIQSNAPVPATAYMVHPFEVTLEGRFANVSGFLGDLRKLVRVKKERIDVRGRLFAVDTLALSKPDGDKKFPTVKAVVTLDAFAFTGGAAPTPGASGTAESTDATTQTSPATGQTTAAGVTP
jgi:Tfp pilus assembly protein PilO